ncbi:MAG TPA: class I SAM-dependent methyltransferase [Candidatus Binatus sp.]|nr:class I SAM-dependent methyltransferase [Candidatus Binatus sp.]
MSPVGDHFAAADAAHFRWTTADPGFAPVEEALLAPRLAGLAAPCLEVGCGEGTNLVRLARRGRPFGIDRSVERVRFAAGAVPDARLATADACALPFRDGVFASVLIRDLLHHLGDPRRAAAEAVRVLVPGGTLLVIEPNGRNPLVALQARLVSAERRLTGFTVSSVLRALEGLPLAEPEVEMAQGFPLRRLVLHYRFGWPGLGRARTAARVLEGLERLGERLLPPRRWSYTVVRSRRR